MSEQAGAEIDRMAAYRQAGVDLDLSNAASQIAINWCRTTWENRGDGFGKPTSFDTRFSASKYLCFDEIRERPGVLGTCGVDGTGTKPEFYERAGDFRGLGIDLAAMTGEDNPVEGAQTVLINNGLVVTTLGEPGEDCLNHIDQLFEGLAEGANRLGAVLFTGEIAVHGDRLQGPRDFTVDWMGDAIGLVHEERILTGDRVEEGDELWGLEEPESARCNGISLIRKVMKRAYGDSWEEAQFEETTLGELVIIPSTIYSGLMNVLTGGYKIEIEPLIDVHGVSHISGGSIWEKTGRMLEASGFGADISDPFDPPRLLLHTQELAEVENHDGSKRPMSDEEAMTTWHGGQGYVIAINGVDGDKLREEASKHQLVAKKIGVVTKQPGIRILSKWGQTPGKVMEF